MGSTKTLRELTKSWVVRVRGSSPKKGPKISVPETPGNALRQAFDSSSSSVEPTTVPIPLERLHGIETHVENLSQMVRTLQVQSHAASGAGSFTSRSTVNSEINTLENVLTRTSTGQSTPQDLRYADLSFLTSMCDEVAELGELLSGQARYLLESAQASPDETETEDFAMNAESQVQSAEFSQASTAGDPNPAMTGISSPPDIDWAYFDRVLDEEQLDFGEPERDEGEGAAGLGRRSG